MSDTRPVAVTPGPDHSPDMQEGDFGLDGDIAATMASALEQVFKDDADTADGDTQPAPASSPSSGEDTGVEGDGAGAGGEAVGEGAAPDPVAPAASAPTDEFSLDRYTEEYFGTKLSREQAADLFGVLGSLQRLTPEQRAQLDATLAGGMQNQYPATTGQPIATPPAAPGSPPVPGLPPRPDDEYEAAIYDRMIAPLATSTAEQIEALRAEQARITQESLARQEREYTAEINAAATSWREAHPLLNDGEYDALIDTIQRSGTFPALVNAHGSPARATEAALEQFFWADPNLRNRAIANIASGRVEGDPTSPDPASPVAQQQAEIEKHRQARAASVAGGGGNTTSRTPPTPKSKDERKAAMIAELGAQGEYAN